MNTKPEDASPTFQPLDEWFLDLLACPACVQRLPLHLGEGVQHYYVTAAGMPIQYVMDCPYYWWKRQSSWTKTRIPKMFLKKNQFDRHQI